MTVAGQAAFGQAATAASRPAATAATCDRKEIDGFAFLVGDSRSGELRQTVTPVFDGCGHLERWTGGPTGEAYGVRAWDARTQKLYYTWVSPVVPPQIWEGRKEQGAWRFYREWELNGEKILSRTYWVPKAGDKFDRIVEQSRDAGKTWRQHALAEYERVR
jgi:hypothetical protein